MNIDSARMGYLCLQDSPPPVPGWPGPMTAPPGAAFARNSAKDFTAGLKPLMEDHEKLDACTRLVNQENRQAMQDLWELLDMNKDGKLTVMDLSLIHI